MNNTADRNRLQVQTSLTDLDKFSQSLLEETRTLALVYGIFELMVQEFLYEDVSHTQDNFHNDYIKRDSYRIST